MLKAQEEAFQSMFQSPEFQEVQKGTKDLREVVEPLWVVQEKDSEVGKGLSRLEE